MSAEEPDSIDTLRHQVDNDRCLMMRLFRLAWKVLAKESRCDAFGGCEYYRVASEYQAADYPSEIEFFIEVRANDCPRGN